MHDNVPCLNSITFSLFWHIYSCLLFYLIPPRTVISNRLIQSCSLERGLTLLTSRESVLNLLYCKWDKGSTVLLSRSTTYFIQKKIIQKIHKHKTSQSTFLDFLDPSGPCALRTCRTQICSKLLSFQATPSITCHFWQNGKKSMKLMSILTLPIGYLTLSYL